MFIPVGDDNRDRTRTPYVTYLFLAVNVLVFIFLQGMGGDLHFTFAYATVPEEILTGADVVTPPQLVIDPVSGNQLEMPGLQPTGIPVYLTLLTSMFMHGGFAHLLGNMLYLWIFGDNLEDLMGHKNYFFFYLACGVVASLSHVFLSASTSMNLLIPSLGASGAISGILGGYILLFPTRRVHVWVFWFIMSVPAFLAVGLWFVFQVVNGMGMLGSDEAAAGGVAYGAHIGGFIAGLILVNFFKKKKLPSVTEKKVTW